MVAGAVLATTALLWFAFEKAPEARAYTHSYPAFEQEILLHNVKSVTISEGSEAKGKLKTGATFTVALPKNDPGLYDLLNAHSVAVSVEARPTWRAAVFPLLPILLVIVSWLLIGFLLGVGFYWGLRWSRRIMTGSTTGGL
jgi:hypothetical protein